MNQKIPNWWRVLSIENEASWCSHLLFGWSSWLNFGEDISILISTSVCRLLTFKDDTKWTFTLYTKMSNQREGDSQQDRSRERGGSIFWGVIKKKMFETDNFLSNSVMNSHYIWTWTCVSCVTGRHLWSNSLIGGGVEERGGFAEVEDEDEIGGSIWNNLVFLLLRFKF